DDIVIGNDAGDVICFDCIGVVAKVHPGIDPGNKALRAMRFWFPRAVLAKDDLTLEVRYRNTVGIGDPQCSDTGGGQISDHRASEPTGPDHKHARGLDLLLPRPTDPLENQMSRVAGAFHRGERHWYLAIAHGQGYKAPVGAFKAMRPDREHGYRRCVVE